VKNIFRKIFKEKRKNGTLKLKASKKDQDQKYNILHDEGYCLGYHKGREDGESEGFDVATGNKYAKYKEASGTMCKVYLAYAETGAKKDVDKAWGRGYNKGYSRGHEVGFQKGLDRGRYLEGYR